MIYNDAWRGVCALYDAVYGPYSDGEDADPESEVEEEETEGEEKEWNA